MHGDVLVDLDLSEFLAAHQENTRALATIALTNAADPSEFGAVRLRGTRVADFSEKPTTTVSTSRLVFAGVAACNREFLLKLSKKTPLSLERDVFPALVTEQRLYGFPFEGSWFDVSTPETYERALKEWGEREKISSSETKK
jgi:mannose-1-phosphate guanylyltransferase